MQAVLCKLPACAALNENKNQFKRSVENADTKNLALRRHQLLAQKIIDEAILAGKPFSQEEFKRKFTGSEGPKYTPLSIALKVGTGPDQILPFLIVLIHVIVIQIGRNRSTMLLLK